MSGTPEIFVTKPQKILPHVIKRDKEGCISYWLSFNDFMKYKDNWGAITNGF